MTVISSGYPYLCRYFLRSLTRVRELIDKPRKLQVIRRLTKLMFDEKKKNRSEIIFHGACTYLEAYVSGGGDRRNLIYECTDADCEILSDSLDSFTLFFFFIARLGKNVCVYQFAESIFKCVLQETLYTLLTNL